MNPRKRFAPVAAGALLALMGLLAAGAAWRESVTYDEVVNIGAGVSYWQRLDMRLSEEHPPLARLIAAFPLLIGGVRADYSNIAWTVSDRLFRAYAGQLYFGELVLKHWNNPRTTLALARLPMLVLTLLLGCMVYLYARTIGGSWGALLSTAVYATTPLFLGHGVLVVTDVPIAGFSVLTLFTAASLWRSPDSTRGVVFGLSLACALLTKFSALLLVVALALFVLSLWLRPLREGPPNLQARRLRATLMGIGWALAAAWAVYLVFSWNQSTSVLYDLNSGPVVRRLLMPPWLYLRGLFLLALSLSRPTYILGHSYPQGVWFYFPLLLWLKSALGFLGLLIVGATAVFWSRGVRAVPAAAQAHWRVLWIALAVFTAVCLSSSLDIGFRHFSVPLVLMILILAPLPQMVANLRRAAPLAARTMAIVIVACAAQCLLTALAAYPFYLTYANAFGSFWPHYELFNDSNLDWDQSLPEVERFVKQRGIKSIAIDHYGYTDAAVSVPQSHNWNCENPTAEAGQWVAVSANLITQVRNCRWLLQYPHETLGGGSMYVVQLPQILPPREAAQTGFMTTSTGGDAREFFSDFIRDPAVVKRSAVEADQTLAQWSAQLLMNHHWLQRQVPRWLHDGGFVDK